MLCMIKIENKIKLLPRHFFHNSRNKNIMIWVSTLWNEVQIWSIQHKLIVLGINTCFTFRMSTSYMSDVFSQEIKAFQKGQMVFKSELIIPIAIQLIFNSFIPKTFYKTIITYNSNEISETTQKEIELKHPTHLHRHRSQSFKGLGQTLINLYLVQILIYAWAVGTSRQESQLSMLIFLRRRTYQITAGHDKREQKRLTSKSFSVSQSQTAQTQRILKYKEPNQDKQIQFRAPRRRNIWTARQENGYLEVVEQTRKAKPKNGCQGTNRQEMKLDILYLHLTHYHYIVWEAEYLFCPKEKWLIHSLSLSYSYYFNLKRLTQRVLSQFLNEAALLLLILPSFLFQAGSRNSSCYLTKLSYKLLLPIIFLVVINWRSLFLFRMLPNVSLKFPLVFFSSLSLSYYMMAFKIFRFLTQTCIQGRPLIILLLFIFLGISLFIAISDQHKGMLTCFSGSSILQFYFPNLVMCSWSSFLAKNFNSCIFDNDYCGRYCKHLPSCRLILLALRIPLQEAREGKGVFYFLCRDILCLWLMNEEVSSREELSYLYFYLV